MSGMSAEDWNLVKAEFDRLCDLPPYRQTQELETCDLSPRLRTEVESLLAAHALEGVLDRSVEPAEDAAQFSSLEPGTRIGAFRIVGLIGRGGMGEVYEALRVDGDFEQRVAIKLLRPEAVDHSGQFDRERRLLASLEHPGIARLIDGGRAPDGRAFMAMEFVEGTPIDMACKARHADLAERLSLFIAVCEAVSYAHARLVIHRDLKPSNIMVDESARVRLLDFGVAGLIEDSGEADVSTLAMITPDYAAPEQLVNAATTIATDIHALGGVLYHLLTGQAPWSVHNASVPAIIRRILVEDPVLPSKIAPNGHDVPRERLAGDLDSIVMKAMRRAPEDRYPTVSALIDDVRRYLENRPVLARGGSTRYMAGRFIRRYRWAVAASVAAVVALLVGAGGIVWQSRQTAIERDVALAEARRSESINRMLTVMFRNTAGTTEGDGATVKQMLDQTAAQLVASVDTSAKSATLITTLSDLYVNMEDNVSADTLLRKARDRGIGRADPVSTAQIDLRLASTAAALGKTEDMKPLLDAAEPVFRADRARFRYEMVELNNARAQLARRSGDVPGAIALLISSLPDAEIVYAENHRDLLTLFNNLLVYMVEANQLEQMPAIFARADAALARTGQTESMQSLGITQLKGMRLLKLDQPAQALVIFDAVARDRRARFGKSAGLAVDLLQTSRAKMAMGDFAGARKVLAEARPMAMENLGPGAVPTLIMGLGLAESMAETGDAPAALRLLNEVGPLVTAMPKVGPAHGLLLRCRSVVSLKLGRRAEAKAYADQAETVFKGLGATGESYLKAIPALRTRIASGA